MSTTHKGRGLHDLSLSLLTIHTFTAGLRPLWFRQALLPPPLPSTSQDSHYCFLPLFLLHAPPSCPWVCMAIWLAWHISLDCDALWQKINTSPVVWYGDKTVIILMLCLCGLSFSLIIEVSDVLYWYHCCWSRLLLQRKELDFLWTNMRCNSIYVKMCIHTV